VFRVFQDRGVMSPLICCLQLRRFADAWGWLRVMSVEEVASALPNTHRMRGYNALHVAANRGGGPEAPAWLPEFWKLLAQKARSECPCTGSVGERSCHSISNASRVASANTMRVRGPLSFLMPYA